MILFKKNCIVLDIPNQKILIEKQSLGFYEDTPRNSSPSLSADTELSQVRLVNNVTILPNSSRILKLKISDSFTNEKNVVYIPSCNADISINESIHHVDNSGNIITIVENNTSNKITLRKNSKLGYVHSTTDFVLRDSNDFDEEPNEILQALTADEITTLRREELNADDFNLEHLNETAKNEIVKLLMQNFKVFSKSYQTLGCTDAITPEFKLLHNFPIQTKPYPIPKIAHDFAKQEIQKLLEAGIIEPSTSNYSSPIIFVKKKSDSKKLKFRMVVDYRLLNSITESFKICLPKIADILHEISGKKWYSVLDLKSAFFQIKLKNSDKQKLAFCSELGNFQPTRLPFGSKNSTSYFHLLISKCLDDLKGSNIQFFLDDIIIAANSISEMNTRLQLVFDRLAKFNLTLDPNKIQICKTNITYLGFNISANGYAPSEDNIQRVTKFPVPQNVKQVQSYLGMMNYFRHLIFNYAEVVETIVNLTRKGTPFVLSENCQDAFNVMQEIILNKPTIKNYDESKPLFLTTDASMVGLCAILLQKDGENFYPIEFFSKQLSPFERNYPSIRRELFAIFMGIKHFREYLYGRHFYLLTDAKSLTYHKNLDKQPDIVKRWLLYLQDFSYNIDHIKGCDNPADFLSRMQIEDVEVNNLFHMGDQLSHSNIKLCQFGLPKYILSDNATYFKSGEIVNFYESLRIEHSKSSIYYPKSNGLLERTHRVLKESVASISQKVHDWSTSLLFFKLHYNNSKHVVTQYTPSELFFGRRVNIPIHSYDDPKYVEDFSTYLYKVQKQLKEFNENVKVNEENYFKKHDKYIKGCNRDKLQLGDKVFMQVDPQVLHPKYKGPYEISTIFRNENYLVKVTEGEEIKFVKVHVSKIFKQPELRENCKSV
ncbi:Retrovirus-related Pol polyprotein from transposon 17.6 [Araneus ventricosus]|uniref:RNA-directed DNA polymerase n=1 Tax=Araneus ventricosus TaxID=182803 RepID=A0A4Y2E9D5_ARAVE|nr:Retrovirus-related Pol polyprotein from transposon 17.6 [Araneus ventricosus]